jgi:tRNA pseudouridine55 synthase
VPPASARRSIDPSLVYTPPDVPDAITDGAVFPIDKPNGCTSFDVVRDIRRLVGHKKVGHAGTLDPLATGLLIVLAARPATRLQDAFMFLRKTYTCTIRLGQTTASHDSETDVEESTDAGGLSDEVIRRGVEHFTGDLEHVPPMYSAVKIEGEKLYEKARRGETVTRPPRPITVYTADVTGIHRPTDAPDASTPKGERTPRGTVDVEVRFECSKGTYIRSLARDIGSHLGVGGHLTALRRTAIGEYTVDDAWTLERLRTAYREHTSARNEPESAP